MMDPLALRGRPGGRAGWEEGRGDALGLGVAGREPMGGGAPQKGAGGGEGSGRPGSSGKRVPAAGTESPSPETAPRRLQGARVRSPPSRDTMKRLEDIMLPDLPHSNPCNRVTPGVCALRGAAGGAAGTRGSGAWGEVGGTRLEKTAACRREAPGRRLRPGDSERGCAGEEADTERAPGDMLVHQQERENTRGENE